MYFIYLILLRMSREKQRKIF